MTATRLRTVDGLPPLVSVPLILMTGYRIGAPVRAVIAAALAAVTDVQR